MYWLTQIFKLKFILFLSLIKYITCDCSTLWISPNIGADVSSIKSGVVIIVEEYIYSFNKSKNLKFKLIYSPEERITGLKIKFKDMLTRKKNYNNELIGDLFINPYRNCIIGKNNFRNCFSIEMIEVGVKPILYIQTLF